MTSAHSLQSSPSRRLFLRTVAGAVSAAAALSAAASAQGVAKHRRLSVTNPQAAPMLESYKKAIRAMLNLPPSDPRNWYRNVLVHTLDCPHGNWWFLPWHRGYLGWFEQTCRELSSDPNFALPYWDWTENPDPSKPFAPRIPAVMFDDVLTPTNPAFIAKYDIFEAYFKDVIGRADYWKLTDPFDPNSPYAQLLVRGLRFNEDLWFDIIKDPRSKLFFDLANARGLTKDRPELDKDTTVAVSAATLTAALQPTDFVGFASSRAPAHSIARGSGVLESQPHNLVHNNIGGFMGDFMSPTDPIFFLHHANIDRVWDVWTRKQQARGLPILPDGYLVQPPVSGTDYFRWSREPFLFFVDSKGQPVTKTRAGDYATIGDFNYDYQPGSGEEVVAITTAAAPPPAAPAQRFSARITDPWVQPDKEAVATVTLPPAVVARAGAAPNPILAEVTIDTSALGHGSKIWVFVDGPADAPAEGPASPYFAGTLSMFGHHVVPTLFTFTVPLSTPVNALRERKQLGAGAALNIRLVAAPGARPHAAPHDVNAATQVTSVVVEAR